MHPTISYYLAHARIAGLRDQARRDSLARDAGRARSGKCERTVAGWPSPSRWVQRQPATR
jgi:hypothetical protein